MYSQHTVLPIPYPETSHVQVGAAQMQNPRMQRLSKAVLTRGQTLSCRQPQGNTASKILNKGAGGQQYMHPACHA